MDIIQMQCYRALMKYGSFSKAADSLFMSQPSVSKYIQSLENECGFRLFIKNGRKIEMTNEGRVMLKECNRLLSYYDQVIAVRDSLRKHGSSNDMSFVLVGVSDMANYGILEGVDQFHLGNPEVNINVTELGDRFCIDSLTNGDADIAFSTDYGIETSQINYQTYCSERLCAVVPVISPLAKLDTIKIYSLKEYNIITTLPKSNIFSILRNACNNSGFEPKVSFQTSKEITALDYLWHHKNEVYVAAEHMFVNFHEKKYKVISIEDSPVFNMVFAWKKDGVLTDKMKKFLDYMSPERADELIGRFSVEGPFFS